VFFCGFLAAVVPDLDGLIGIIGGIGGALLNVTIPALISLRLRPAKHSSLLTTCLDCVCVGMGLVFGVWGSYAAITLTVSEGGSSGAADGVVGVDIDDGA